jgi:putative tricarboxylic transport membrane protein
LFEIAGFVPTAAILFFSVAFGFGSRRYLRDILIGVALSLVAYVGFVHALGLRLPAGILEGVL